MKGKGPEREGSYSGYYLSLQRVETTGRRLRLCVGKGCASKQVIGKQRKRKKGAGPLRKGTKKSANRRSRVGRNGDQPEKGRKLCNIAEGEQTWKTCSYQPMYLTGANVRKGKRSLGGKLLLFRLDVRQKKEDLFLLGTFMNSTPLTNPGTTATHNKKEIEQKGDVGGEIRPSS